ncbi:MAG: outer membrane protein beta-barrel domain [Bacteroidetes bacterium]|jgi:hypothetical protein|nr:outer membrane protein beta-barrel domain [Bacteroidota bacterium]
MKKTILSASFIAAFIFSGTAQSSWRMGVYAGAVGNHSVFTGGDQVANARFHHNELGTGVWGISFRKTYTDHWSLQTGFQFSEVGYQFTIAENYSLMNKAGHYTNNTIKATTFAIPVSVLYHFKPNCKNVRWYVSAGISLVGTNAQTSLTKNVIPEGETATNNISLYLEQTAEAKAKWAFNGQLETGFEKTFKSGRTFGVALFANGGFIPLLNTTVNYSIDNQQYKHTFSNFGNYAGIKFTYQFRNFKSHKAAALPAAY